MYERGFTGTHFAMECKNSMASVPGPERKGHLPDLVQHEYLIHGTKINTPSATLL
jgi:hypothetical protein